MLPVRARAETEALTVLPRRLAFIYINGVHIPDWKPSRQGCGFRPATDLSHLAEHKNYLTVVSGLAQDKGRPNGDGPGDHARAMSSLSDTVARPIKTNGANIRVGVSADQVAAQLIGHRTAISFARTGRRSGASRAIATRVYSCAYSSNMSWRSPTQPNPKEVDPRLVFERLFGCRYERRKRQARATRQTIRKERTGFRHDDAVAEETGRHRSRKMDEYLTAVREIEQRITHAEKSAGARVAQLRAARRHPSRSCRTPAADERPLVWLSRPI